MKCADCNCEIEECKIEKNGRELWTRLLLKNGNKVNILGVYGPNTELNKWWNDFIERYKSHKIDILTGDFNFIENKEDHESKEGNEKKLN